MSSGPTRRILLKLAAALPVSLPLVKLHAGTGNGILKYRLVKNQVTGSGIQAGAMVLADCSVNTFAGDGFYLYPDWGNPVVYEVKARGGRLAFHYPGADSALWETSANHKDNRFSGRVEGVAAWEPDDPRFTAGPAANGLQVLDLIRGSLEVPELPVA